DGVAKIGHDGVANAVGHNAPLTGAMHDADLAQMTQMQGRVGLPRLPCDKRLADGSYLSRIDPSEKDRTRQTPAICLRMIEHRLEDVSDAEPIDRLATSVLDPQQAPAQELAALNRERGEIETALDEFKTHLRGARSSMGC
ncbi:MAG: hypothetical protein ACYCSR_11150, partial [Thiomonas sp.]